MTAADARTLCLDIEALRSRIGALYDGATPRETALLDLVDDLARQAFAQAARIFAEMERK